MYFLTYYQHYYDSAVQDIFSSECESDNENDMFIDGEIHKDDDHIAESDISEYRELLASIEAGW